MCSEEKTDKLEKVATTVHNDLDTQILLLKFARLTARLRSDLWSTEVPGVSGASISEAKDPGMATAKIKPHRIVASGCIGGFHCYNYDFIHKV